MKKFFLFALAGLLAFPTFAQTQKGQTITSGEGGLYFNRTSIPQQDRVVIYSGSLLVNRGRFYKDNWLFGYTGGVSYTHARADYFTTDTKVRGNTINVYAGLYLRRYWPVLDRLSVYAGGGLSAFRQEVNTKTEPASFINWGVTPEGEVGAMYALSNRIAVTATIRNNFPTSVSDASFGIAILSGQKNGSSSGFSDVETPQVQKGRWVLGVSANISGSKQTGNYSNPPGNTERKSSAAIGLSAGHFIRNNVIIGLAANYQINKEGGDATPEATTYSTSISPFMRSYMGMHRLRPFAQAGLEYGLYKSSDREVMPTYLSGNIGAGLAYMAGERFIIQTTLCTLSSRYNWYPGDDVAVSSSDYTIQLSASTRANISVAYSL